MIFLFFDFFRVMNMIYTKFNFYKNEKWLYIYIYIYKVGLRDWNSYFN